MGISESFLQKLAIFHLNIASDASDAQKHVAVFIDAYELREQDHNNPEFRARVEKAAAKIGPVLDNAVAEIEKGIKKYYEVCGKVFTPSPPEVKP